MEHSSLANNDASAEHDNPPNRAPALLSADPAPSAPSFGGGIDNPVAPSATSSDGEIEIPAPSAPPGNPGIELYRIALPPRLTGTVESARFYAEFRGHLVQHLTIVLDNLRKDEEAGGRREGGSLLWTAGDSSLDNKFWLEDRVEAAENYKRVCNSSTKPSLNQNPLPSTHNPNSKPQPQT
jgi:hypothetical protein